MRKVGLIITLSLLFASCRAHDPYAAAVKMSDDGNCEDAARDIAGQGSDTLSKVESAGGAVASYAVTAVGYTSDALLVLTGGIVLAAAVCSPVIALDVATKGGANSANCFSDVGVRVVVNTRGSANLGDVAYSSTAAWRGDDYTPTALALHRVASCYQRRGDTSSLANAQKQLVAIKISSFWPGIDRAEQVRIDADLKHLNDKLAALPDGAIEAEPTPTPSKAVITVTQVVGDLSWRYVDLAVASAAQARKLCANTDGGKWRLPKASEANAALAQGFLGSGAHAFAKIIDFATAFVDGDQILAFKAAKVREIYESEHATGLLCVNGLESSPNRREP